MLQTDLMVFTPTMHAAEALKIPGDTRPTLLDTHKIAEHTKIGQMAIGEEQIDLWALLQNRRILFPALNAKQLQK